MKNVAYAVTDWLGGIYTIEKVNVLQQEILKTADKTQISSEALAQAYETLPDEQKIAFILAGGVPSLLYPHQQYIEPMRTDPDTETGQLPVLC